MNDLVSIIIPIYNMADSIERAIHSILMQDYSNIEIILVDDGSQDDTYSLCQKLAKENSQIKVFHIENSGPGPARNFGIKKASGTWVYFPDADDYIEPNAISTMVASTCEGKYDLVVFGFIYVNRNNRIIRKKTYQDQIIAAEKLRCDYSNCMSTTSTLGIQGAPWNKLFKLETIQNNHITFPPLRRHEDEAFIATYMCYANMVHFIPNILYSYSANDLRKEWQKYPIDYYQTVIHFYETRKQNILTWNPNDTTTHEFVRKEYICNVIKSLELSFSPKMNLNRAERIKWMQKIIDSTQIEKEIAPNILGPYQKIILLLIQSKKINIVYSILHLKVLFEHF